MILDLLIGIIASLIASLIVGFFSNKLFKDVQQKTIYKIYFLFLSFVTFITTMMFAFLINSKIINRILNMTDINVFTIYKYSSSYFIIILMFVSVITFFIIAIDVMQSQTNNLYKLSDKTINYKKK